MLDWSDYDEWVAQLEQEPKESSIKKRENVVHIEDEPPNEGEDNLTY